MLYKSTKKNYIIWSIYSAYISKYTLKSYLKIKKYISGAKHAIGYLIYEHEDSLNRI